MSQRMATGAALGLSIASVVSLAGGIPPYFSDAATTVLLVWLFFDQQRRSP